MNSLTFSKANCLLKTQNLSLTLGQKNLCRHLTLSLRPGEMWGLLGANGSGKTTLLHTLAGLRLPTAGDVYLNEKPLAQHPIKFIAQNLGLLFQDTPAAFPQTVYHYALAGRHPHLSYFAWESAEDRAITHTALANMELTELLHQNIQTLSGGERARVAIATLLVQAPHIYLLDEPTNHLDLRHQIKVMQHFKHLTKNKGITVLAALHDVNLAQRYCDHIIMLLQDGEVLQGETSRILTAESLMRLYRHPFRAQTCGEEILWVAD